jgi:twitching motility protein PilT
MKALAILKKAVEENASDIFLVPGTSYSLKINGQIRHQGEEALTQDLLDQIIGEIYEMAENRSMEKIQRTGDDDFSFSVRSLARFRASVFKQRGSIGAIIRVVHFELPDPGAIGIPQEVLGIAGLKSGLALVTGSAGSGKSTTLACIIDRINKSRNAHIITLEDPIEYLHRHQKSIVTQREILTDSEDYGAALRAALRQAPDVILLGELRDYETIRTAMTAAETGHLVISTLHTTGAANTIDRIIDVFPQNQQNQIRTQLAMVLQIVVSQQLVPTEDDRILPAFEIMVANSAIRNMIRDNKTHQLNSVILSGREEGMIPMDQSLLQLVLDGAINRETALNYAMNKELLEKRLPIDL